MYGHALRRFTDHKPVLVGIDSLDPGHAAAIDARTRYRARVTDPRSGVRVLVSGWNNRKIGGRIVKGRWRGMPIYTLTLEERATCPRSCRHWLDCYGNKMNWSRRLIHGAALERAIERELVALQARHAHGFVVRLHVLGDFYSVAYVQRWLDWLDRFPALHVYGYTAWPASSAIGAAVATMSRSRWERFAVRTSNLPLQPRATTTVYYQPEGPTIGDAIVCPAQTGKTECCATCGLCWQTQRNIAFLAH